MLHTVSILWSQINNYLSTSYWSLPVCLTINNISTIKKTIYWFQRQFLENAMNQFRNTGKICTNDVLIISLSRLFSDHSLIILPIYFNTENISTISSLMNPTKEKENSRLTKVNQGILNPVEFFVLQKDSE
jgi:hypothetical protein